MQHEMRLAPAPFKMIYDGIKTIELRLYDEKRSRISIGDDIVFVSTENTRFRMRVRVLALHRFDSFAGLYAALPLTKCGYLAQDVQNASPDDMLEYYSADMQDKFGVVGIEFEVSSKPYRDLYRFEPFLAELSEQWQMVPDWRFGQLMLNFRYWLERNNYGDGFYLEDDRYTELLRQYMDSILSSDK